ncbi:hypothetical protein GOV05_01265 [Candidatus Woesearchaeota archaeon]|nr:hypothetical protein [Candidatus Woesearchaeota archaeon]
MSKAKKFFETVTKSFLPQKYKSLISGSNRGALSYILVLVLTYCFLNSVFYTPQITSFYKNFDENLEGIKNIYVSLNVETNSSLKILEKPLIVIDSSANTTSDEYLLITGDAYYKKGLFTYKNTSLKNIDLLKTLKDSKTKITLFLVLLIPTLFFFYYVLKLLSLAALVLVCFFLVFLVTNFFEHKTKPRTLLLASIYSLTPYLVLSLLLRFETKITSYFAILIYFSWYVVVVYLLKGEKITKSKGLRTHKPLSGGKTVYFKKKPSSGGDTVSERDMEKINKLLKK